MGLRLDLRVDYVYVTHSLLGSVPKGGLWPDRQGLFACPEQGEENEMDEVGTKIVEILKKHMKEPRDDIALDTELQDLSIESLDLAMIVFDIEDTFGIEIPYNANEEVEDFKTVGSVVDKVRELMQSKDGSAAAAGA